MAASPYQSYRSSDVRGLDQIPAHWEEERAKHFFRPVDERSETGEEQLLSVAENRGVELRDDEKVNMRKAESYEGYKLCQPGDLVINSMWAWKRGLGISDYSGIISTAYSVFRLRDSTLFEEKYLDWLLRTDLYVGEYLCRSQGVWKSRLTLSDREFLDMPIIRPPIEEQRAIVNEIGDTLDDIEAYIAKKQDLIDLLGMQRRAIINRAVTQGLQDEVKMNDTGVEWLGKIPYHWKSASLKYLVDFYGGGTPSRNVSEFWNGSIPWVSPKDMKVDYIDRAEESITESGLRQSAAKLVPANSVLIVFRSGILKRKIPVAVNRTPVSVNQDLKAAAIRDKDQLTSRYLAYLIKGANNRLLFEWSSRGATVESLDSGRVGNTPIPIPPIEEQKQIVSHIDERTSDIDDAIDQAERQIELMEQYRTSLVAEVVTGKVNVREKVEAQI